MFPSTLPALSIVVPCYNEEENMQELIRRLTEVCHKIVESDYEIVLVNDGSSDLTWAKIKAFANDDGHVVAVNLSRNHGHQLALSAGLSVSSGARVFIIDADLQDPPELLDQMMTLMDQGAAVVYGQRIERRGESLFKRASASVFYRLLERLVDIEIPRDSGDFRLMSRRAVTILNTMPERSRFVRGMVSWIGLKQVPLRYERHPRFAGKTKYPLHKMVRFAIDAITSFSVRPLRIASYCGVISAITTFVLSGYALYSWVSGKAVPGWTSLTLIVLSIGTVQLLTLGVFGEYLGRLYMEAKQRPLFIIDEVFRTAPGEKS
jgi:glycosyltransferase involved in cell wall biosynthesis